MARFLCNVFRITLLTWIFFYSRTVEAQCDQAVIAPILSPLPCDGEMTILPLDATKSQIPGVDSLMYVWATNCPNAIFDDPNSATPILTFDSYDPFGAPTECGISLQVKDFSDPPLWAECRARFAVEQCDFTCTNSTLIPAAQDMESSAFSLSQSLIKMSKLCKKVGACSKQENKQHKTLANMLHKNSWMALSQLPQVIFNCNDPLQCVTINTTANLQTVTNNVEDLFAEIKFLKKVIKSQLGVLPHKTKKIMKKALLFKEETLQQLGDFPTTVDVCDPF